MNETNDLDSDTPGTVDTDPSDPRRSSRRSPARWAMWIALGVIAVVALGYGAILIYANFINDPADELTADDLAERLDDPVVAVPDTTGSVPEADEADAADASDAAPSTTDDASPTATTDATTSPATTSPAAPAEHAADVDGVWAATEASEMGYRVKEILFGVDTEGVGRTNQITGSLTIAGTQVTEGAFQVDMASVESDDSRRDGQFRGRIMTVSEFPTADFVLTEPIELGEIPAEGEQITATATGDLTLRGVTNSVTFDVTAQLQNDRIGVLGNIPVVFADYEIANPSMSGITTEDHGLLEFVLLFER